MWCMSLDCFIFGVGGKWFVSAIKFGITLVFNVNMIVGVLCSIFLSSSNVFVVKFGRVVFFL